MGSVASKVWTDLNEYYYHNGQSESQSESGLNYHNDVLNTTPTVTTKAVTIPCVDPRSPADDFERTPILISDANDKDKHGSAEEVDILFKPKDELNLFDPRSPSVGILRTPLDLLIKESRDSINSLPAMQLSFGSTASELENSSDTIAVSESKCLTSTPLNDGKAMKTESDGQKVRTPLACVQKQTPNRNINRNQKQLEITKRAHINSHRKKSMALIESGDRSSIGQQVMDGKENIE